jgi:hypothetical protein
MHCRAAWPVCVAIMEKTKTTCTRLAIGIQTPPSRCFRFNWCKINVNGIQLASLTPPLPTFQPPVVKLKWWIPAISYSYLLVKYFPGGNERPKRDADHTPPSSTEVVNEQELYILPPCAYIYVLWDCVTFFSPKITVNVRHAYLYVCERVYGVVWRGPRLAAVWSLESAG